jgi:diacylglycerol kinase (ATP)
MGNNNIILVNLLSYNGKKSINYFKKNNIKFSLLNDYKNKKSFVELINKRYDNYIICGGDGTLNKFVNRFMSLSTNNKEKISIGIIPCGRANDLARNLKIPTNITRALKKIKNNKKKSIDIIKVNNSYLLTGGGLGLPAEIIEDINRFSSKKLGKFFKKFLGSSIYSIFTLKKLTFGYKGIDLIEDNSSKKLLAIYLLNQSFIGKKYKIIPEAKNDDGLLNSIIIKTPPTFFSNFKTLFLVTKGKSNELQWVSNKIGKKMNLKLTQPSYFMADGELFEKNNEFSIEVMPDNLKVIY